MIRFQIALLVVLLLGCSQQRSSQENESAQHAQDVEAVKALILRGADLQYQGDWVGYIATRTDDAIWVVPKLRDPMDKEAASEFYTNIGEKYDLSAIRPPEFKDVIVSGDLAFVRAVGATKSSPKDGGEPYSAFSRHWFILQRQSDGEWKVSHDTSSNIPYDEGDMPR